MKTPIYSHWSQILLPIMLGVILGCILVAWKEEARPKQMITYVEKAYSRNI